MRIKQRLKITTVVSIITVLFILLVLSLSLYRINKANNTAKVAGDLVLNTFERVTLRNDYLRTTNERAKTQWFAAHERINGILMDASKTFTATGDKKTIAELLKNHESIRNIFSAIVENREKSKATAEAAVISQEVEDRLLSQLNRRVYDEVLHGRELLASSRKAYSLIIGQAVVGIAFSFLVLLAAVIINSWAMDKAITDRVQRLGDSALVIGGGDMDHRIDIKGDDEFAELAGAFNAMTAQLQRSYHDLTSEVAVRKRAEEALGKAYEELELRIQERTKELKDAQRALLETNETLEQRVVERTAELQAVNVSLRHSRLATLNMMEDALAASRQAEETNAELQSEISERMWAEETLRLSEEKFSLAFANNPAAIAMTRLDDGLFLDVNDTWLAMNGYNRDEIIGLSARKLSIWPSVGASNRFVQELRGKGSLHWREQEFRKKSGEVFVVQLSAQVMTVRGEQVILSTLLDVTERKKAEADILKLSEDMAARNLELEDANKELESFIYSVSHDLRAPLRHVSEFARFVVEDYTEKLDLQGKDYLDRIRHGSEKMSQLIDALLELSQISRQNISRSDVDLSRMALSIVSDLREDAPSGTVEVTIAEGITAYVDPLLLDVVLSNLLGNAWKFTSKTATPRIEFDVVAKDGKTAYFVRDNGAGFDPQYGAKMFLPFHRLHTSDEFEGTGIGLAIVERAIRRHGGRVWAEGEVGKGATFYFDLG